MTYGFKIVQEMISVLSQWTDEKEYTSVDDFVGAAVPKVVDWQYLNLNHVSKARINQDACIKCGRCYAACEDTSHQAISMKIQAIRPSPCRRIASLMLKTMNALPATHASMFAPLRDVYYGSAKCRSY